MSELKIIILSFLTIIVGLLSLNYLLLLISLAPSPLVLVLAPLIIAPYVVLVIMLRYISKTNLAFGIGAIPIAYYIIIMLM